MATARKAASLFLAPGRFLVTSAARSPPVLLNGVRVDGKAAKVSVWDTTVQRGDGMFEVVRVRPDGRPVGLSLHMDRLFSGAKALDFTIPASYDQISRWITEVSAEGGQGMVRLLLTRGSTAGSGQHLPGFDVERDAPATVVVMWQPLPKWPGSVRLFPTKAWWHPAGSWQTVKWLSYGPNMMMSRWATKAGYDDALLLSEQSVVLDGPTFAVGWFKNKTLYTPSSVELGLLPSCTLALALDCARDMNTKVVEGVFQLKEILQADEVFVTSSTKDVMPVSAIGEHKFGLSQPLVAALAQRFKEKNL
jgi:branched-subunit amino acid aminotransferase/4-amino-4-deoxychorismate lyase